MGGGRGGFGFSLTPPVTLHLAAAALKLLS